MKHGKILDAENLQDEFGTLFDVSNSSSSSSAPIDCHDSTRPIAFSGLKNGQLVWTNAIGKNAD